MEKKRTDLGHSPPLGPAQAISETKTKDDLWSGEDARLDETARSSLLEDAAEERKVVSFVGVLLACAVLCAGVWTLVGYTVYRLFTS
jgi:hypothetical protein